MKIWICDYFNQIIANIERYVYQGYDCNKTERIF